MKKENLAALALLLGITSGVNAAWWNEEYDSRGVHNAYTKEDEDLATKMAIAASLNDANTVSRNTWGQADVDEWVNDNFDLGQSDTYNLVKTQRNLKKIYNPIEIHNKGYAGTSLAQNVLTEKNHLSDMELMDYASKLSLLDRSMSDDELLEYTIQLSLRNY